MFPFCKNGAYIRAGRGPPTHSFVVWRTADFSSVAADQPAPILRTKCLDVRQPVPASRHGCCASCGMSFPHFYSVRAEAGSDNGVEVTSGGVPALRTAPPPEFGGPGNQWSPETLAVAAVGDCLVLTFKAIARTRRFAFTHITCDVQGKLDRVDRVTSFTEFHVNVRLDLPAVSAVEEARRLVDMARSHCLITNSMKASVHYDLTIRLNSHAVVMERLPKAS